jgi:hypothetical protein
VNGGSATGGDDAEVGWWGGCRDRGGAGWGDDDGGSVGGCGVGGHGAVGCCRGSGKERGEGECVLHFCGGLGLPLAGEFNIKGMLR